MNNEQLLRVRQLTNRISLTCLGKNFEIIVSPDLKYGERIFIQLSYSAVCVKSGVEDTWKGRKWYLSEHMADDEIIKTCFAAFEACIKHEILEGFKVDDKILFNPHVHFESLLAISHKEVMRTPNQ